MIGVLSKVKTCEVTKTKAVATVVAGVIIYAVVFVAFGILFLKGG